ncbi:MAG: glycosyl transferase group 1 [uncultured bacterium]|nr:MAG: glycosyl transferase group 1 [uncultured bacterium]
MLCLLTAKKFYLASHFIYFLPTKEFLSMNIAIDIRSLTDKKRTGVGEYTYELLDSLFALDKENNYFLFYNSFKDVRDGLPNWLQANVHFVATKFPNKIFNILLLLKIFNLDKLLQSQVNKKLTSTRVDRLDYWFSPNFNFTNLSKDTKHVLTVHDLSFEFLPSCFSKKMLLWHSLIKTRQQVHKAHFVFTPSQNTKNDLVDVYHLNPNSIKVLYPGISKKFLQFLSQNIDREKLKCKYNLPEKFIFFLGTLEPRKNILSIIDAYRKSNLINKKIHLVIAGTRGWKYDKIISSIDNTRGVNYIGYVDAEDKPALYKLAELFVYPSLYEGFGFPVLEALISQVPVITSNRSSLSEIVDDGVKLVNPHNIIELKNSLLEVIKNKKDNVCFSQKDKFNWDKTAREFLEMLVK